MAGGAAVWCWYDVRAGCCCPLLYSYVGRGVVRFPTGAASSARRGAAAGRGLSSGGGRRARSPTGAGIIGPARPVRGDLSSGAGCCCPLLYSYVGRGGGRSPTGAASSTRRGAGGGVRSPTGAGIIEPPRESHPRKTPHGKGQQKKEVGAAAGRVYLFFCVKFSGGWNHPPPVLLSSGGWNPSRAILSRVAVKMYPCTLSPA